MKKSILISLTILLTSCGKASEEKEAILINKIDSLKTEISELQRANDTLSDHLMKKAFLTREYPSYFDTIPEPERFLLEKIQEKPVLIPKKAVLGGTMRFTAVTFIDNELFVAEFEDGHVLGKAVYRYTMDREGELTFRHIGDIKR